MTTILDRVKEMRAKNQEIAKAAPEFGDQSIPTYDQIIEQLETKLELSYLGRCAD